MKSETKKCLFVCSVLGKSSEVWMWRQLTGFQNLDLSLLSWRYENPELYSIGSIPHRLLKNHKTMPAVEPGYWKYRLRCLPGVNFYATVGEEKQEVKRWIEEVHPDVILAQFGTIALRILPIARELGIPLVAHFHGSDLSRSLRNRWYRWSLLKSLGHFAAIVTVGTHQRKWLIQHGVRKGKVHLIPCGVPIGTFNRNRTSRESGEINFIAVSRLVEKKGIEYTIRAFHRVHEELPDTELHLYGDGPLRERLVRLIHELNLENHVHLNGSVSSAEVKAAMQNADIFVQHSIVAESGDSEGSPVSSMEAASMSLPIVATVSPGFVDQVVDGETGFLVPQKDAGAMADRMLMLAKDRDLRERMGRAARQRMIDHFDARRQIELLEDVVLRTAGISLRQMQFQ